MAPRTVLSGISRIAETSAELYPSTQTSVQMIRAVFDIDLIALQQAAAETAASAASSGFGVRDQSGSTSLPALSWN